MPNVIPVKFAYATRDLWFDPRETGAQVGDHVIVSTERGTEIGLVTDDSHEVSARELSGIIGKSVLKPVLRVASDEDLDRAEELADKGDEAFPVFRHLISERGLDMKPVGVEYLFGGEKAVCYFAAEERIDFRQLVRDLSRELHVRIDMRQIGVREEAAFVGGFGHCGQELCCARFGLSLEPVSIRMAKEQDLPLTSNKISGACGRLMCCLRYEFEAYRDFKGRAPKRNAVIDTPLGKAKVIEYDTPKEQLALRIENGKVVRIPLAEMVASEAAVKKSEDLHCPCRPDTVVRASLEKLNSPDVQMALAELDRKMGVGVEDAYDDADLFVEAKPRKKRNRKRGRNGMAKQQVQSSQQQAGRQGKPEGEQPKSPQEADDKKRRRRRKKRTAPGSEQQQQQAQQTRAQDQPQAEGRRRRHHRSSGANSQAGGHPEAQGGEAKEQARPRRRPGDRGGVKAEAPAPSEQQAPKRRRRRRRRSNASGNAE